MTRGHTLLEIATVLAIFGTALGLVAPRFARYRDVAAVVEARESVAGLIAAARVVAVARGGADVVLRTRPASASIVASADTLRTVRVEPESGVVVELGGRDEVDLHYDDMGVGRLASATVRFRRGAIERALVVSSFGRVRRR